MNRKLFFYLLAFLPFNATAQQLLTLDSCRAMALRNNKQLSVSRVKQQVATNLRKSARTKYLPHISALGGYEWTSKEISLLSDDQKAALSHLGDGVAQKVGESATNTMGQISPSTWAALGLMGITPESLQSSLSAGLGEVQTGLNGIGNRIVDAFHTDTRNMFAGSIMLTQPIFMGGAIIAMNKMADIGEDMAANAMEQ